MKFSWIKLLCILGSHQTLIDGLVQECSISTANALEILQSCSNHIYIYMDNRSWTFSPPWWILLLDWEQYSLENVQQNGLNLKTQENEILMRTMQYM